MCDSLTSEFAVQYFRAPTTKIYNLEKNRALDLVHNTKELDSEGIQGVQLFFQNDTENRNRMKEDQKRGLLLSSQPSEST